MNLSAKSKEKHDVSQSSSHRVHERSARYGGNDANHRARIRPLLPVLPLALVRLLALADHRLASVVLLALVALLRVLVARAVVLLARNSVVSLGLALMLLVFRVVAVSKDVLRLSGPGLHPTATLAPVTRGLATGTARMVPDTSQRVPGVCGGCRDRSRSRHLAMARVMGRATMAATTRRLTGEVPTGAFWSAAETE